MRPVSICRVLSFQGCQIAARTYRAWARANQHVADRTVSDAIVEDAVRDAAWTIDEHGPMAGVRRLTPEGLYGRRKMTALIKRSMPSASPGSVDRAMKALGLNGIRRAKGIRTTIPAKDGKRAGDLLDRDFTAPAPNRTWGDGFHLRTHVGLGSRTCRSSSMCSPKRSSPGTPRPARREPGDDTITDGDLATPARGTPHRTRRVGGSFGCREPRWIQLVVATR